MKLIGRLSSELFEGFRVIIDEDDFQDLTSLEDVTAFVTSVLFDILGMLNFEGLIKKACESEWHIHSDTFETLKTKSEDPSTEEHIFYVCECKSIQNITLPQTTE
mgnify:CR=1 FL=1